MNYQAFTNDSLTMMYQGARGALAVDDTLSELGKECRFRVRETPEWKIFAANLEVEMLRRGMIFEVIDWSDDLFSAVSLSDPINFIPTPHTRASCPTR